MNGSFRLKNKQVSQVSTSTKQDYGALANLCKRENCRVIFGYFTVISTRSPAAFRESSLNFVAFYWFLKLCRCDLLSDRRQRAKDVCLLLPCKLFLTSRFAGPLGEGSDLSRGYDDLPEKKLFS